MAIVSLIQRAITSIFFFLKNSSEQVSMIFNEQKNSYKNMTLVEKMLYFEYVKLQK